MTGQRNIRQPEFMSEAEALMWAAESDPFLSSGMGSLFLLDARPEFDRFLATMARASTTLLRLRERVDPGFGIAAPRWVIDDQFDITQHVRLVRLAGSGTLREVLDLTARVFQDPFDPNRPLWEFVVVDGGRSNAEVPGAVIMKLHHSVSDGIGAVRLAEMYLDFERHPPIPADVTPDEVPTGANGDRGAVDRLVGELDHVVRQQFDIVRRVAAEVSMWGADPTRAQSAISTVVGAGRSVGDTFDGGYTPDGGSPLWKTRSRHRHLEVFDLDLDAVKAASKRHEVSINDVFVGGSVLAAARYHVDHGVTPSAFHLSFITSTRNDDDAGGNAFAPIPFSVDASVRPVVELLTSARDAMGEARAAIAAGGSDLVELASGLANLLPASVVSRVGRARGAKQDWATSNLRGAPFPIFVAGGEITHMYPIGPLAGTAFNVTAMSYNGGFHFGVHIDPYAVEDPEHLRASLVSAYEEILDT